MHRASDCRLDYAQGRRWSGACTRGVLLSCCGPMLLRCWACAVVLRSPPAELRPPRARRAQELLLGGLLTVWLTAAAEVCRGRAARSCCCWAAC